MYKFSNILIMFKDQCISITDLRTKTKECLEDLEREPKYVFVNNKPIAVLLDINEYEIAFMKPELKELSLEEVDSATLKAAEKARRTKKSDLVNL